MRRLLLVHRARLVTGLLAETSLLAVRSERSAHLDTKAAALLLDRVFFVNLLFLIFLAELGHYGLRKEAGDKTDDPYREAQHNSNEPVVDVKATMRDLKSITTNFNH